ncbi:hypothetical protein Q7O_003056 [Pectobacterium carotovorum subsp. carotovorum PCCS1]|nr:hypothetical protein [Pectobacterium carotovorum subsp. carotovorum PCCS1]
MFLMASWIVSAYVAVEKTVIKGNKAKWYLRIISSFPSQKLYL